MRERDLFIDGRWRPAHSGRRLAINDPATGERVGSTALADGADVDAAVTAAERALPGWASTHADARARILHRAADLIVERLPTIAELLTREQGSRSQTQKRKSASASRSSATMRRKAGESAEHPGVVARGRSKPRRLFPGRRRRRHHALELPGRHLRLEARAGAGGRLHAGRQAAARDAARNRPHRAMLRGRGPSRRRAQRPAGDRSGSRRGARGAPEGPHGDGDRFDRRRPVDHARGGGHDEAPVVGAWRPVPVHRVGRRRRRGGGVGRRTQVLLQHGADLHRREPDPCSGRSARNVCRSSRGGDWAD